MSFPQVFPQVCGKLLGLVPVMRLSITYWPIRFLGLMLGSWLRDHFTACFFHHEHLHWERLRQSEGVPERTSGGVRFWYGQHPDHGSSCIRGLRRSCVCTGRCDGQLLNRPLGGCKIPPPLSYWTRSPHTPQHHGNSLTHRNRNAQPHCG